MTGGPFNLSSSLLSEPLQIITHAHAHTHTHAHTNLHEPRNVVVEVARFGHDYVVRGDDVKERLTRKIKELREGGGRRRGERREEGKG